MALITQQEVKLISPFKKCLCVFWFTVECAKHLQEKEQRKYNFNNLSSTYKQLIYNLHKLYVKISYNVSYKFSSSLP